MRKKRSAMVLSGIAALMLAGIPELNSVAMAQETPPPPPRIFIGLNGGFFGDGWPSETALAATADDPQTIGAPDLTIAVTTDTDGNFHIDTPVGVEPGWFINVTDGEITKTHTVRDISITDVDPATDIVRGRADPGSVLDYVGANWIEAAGKSTVTDGDGVWIVDLSGTYDVSMADNAVAPGESGLVALQIDDSFCFDPFSPPFCKGDFTYIDWVGPVTLAGLLDDMVVDGLLPNQGVATGIARQAEKAPLRSLTAHLTGLVGGGRITQATKENILAMVAWMPPGR